MKQSLLVWKLEKKKKEESRERKQNAAALQLFGQKMFALTFNFNNLAHKNIGYSREYHHEFDFFLFDFRVAFIPELKFD